MIPVVFIWILLTFDVVCNGFLDLNNKPKKITNPFGKKYTNELLNRKAAKERKVMFRKYPVSKLYFEEQLKRLNSRNMSTSQYNRMLNNQEIEDEEEEEEDQEVHYDDDDNYDQEDDATDNALALGIGVGSFLFNNMYGIKIDVAGGGPPQNQNQNQNQNQYQFQFQQQQRQPQKQTKSENFEVVKNSMSKFTDVGGYQNVKLELTQCLDILKDYQKYKEYNVRIPKGLILEGPPGTGKTLFAKALAGESGCSFIAVSGSDFQEKYVGVGSSRVKELFKLANANIPCIIFIDEVDAVGRKRSGDGETSSNERDSTLNALLVELDGFKNNTGIFLVAATNRIDMLDTALTRPGRIDKKIYIGIPDKVTREAIIDIHIRGKPCDHTIKMDDLVLYTEGCSGAQIENLLNEAMLNALRHDRKMFTSSDFDLVLNKMMVGWQPNEHEFTSDIIDHIAIHEMGHAIVGIFSKHHSKVTKVIINLSSPRSPGYTVFESTTSNIFTRESLFEHLMILLSGRIAEELFYGVSVTTGALNDFEEALKLAEKMVVYYGMGTNLIYPSTSEKYKEKIDNDVTELIQNAYSCAEIMLNKSKDLVFEGSERLKRDKFLNVQMIEEMINHNHPFLKDILKLSINDKNE